MHNESRIKLMLEMRMPSHKAGPPTEHKRESLEEKVRNAIDLVDSGHESRKEWEFLRRLNNKLVTRYKTGKCGDRGLKVLQMLQPVMEKYGQYDHEGVLSCPELHTAVARRR